MESIKIETTKVFEKSIKKLAKHYPGIKNIFKKIIDDLEKNPRIGQEIQGHQHFYKVRYGNPDAGQGKSGGFRVIYFYSQQQNYIVLADIYSKKDQENEDWHVINRVMSELQNNQDSSQEEETDNGRS